MRHWNTYIFDLDGTLLDTLDDLAAATNYALRQYGMPEHTRDDIRRFIGNGVRMLMVRAVPGGEQNPRFEDALATFREYYLHHAQDVTAPYPGIAELLSELRRCGCRVAVVSNKFCAATEALCRPFFPTTVEVAIGENEAAGIRRKPAPDTVNEALRQLGADAATAVYVGDSEVDILTARAAQLPCISVLWGFRDRQFLLEHGATLFANSPDDLLRL